MISSITDHAPHDDRAADERLEPADLDLEPGVPAPFEFTPATSWSPLVISFPHVGLEWPADEPRPRPAVNFARNADLEVDRLYPDAAALGAATVRARYSRLLIDLNRANDDVSAALVPDHPAPQPRQPPWASAPGGARSPAVQNRGLIWRTAVGNISILSGALPYAELLHRLRRYYDPYHRALEILLARRRARFGYAVLLEAHSMPGSIPGDLVLGTFEGGACSSELETLALTALSAPGPLGVPLTVRLNDPYRGGELVRKFGRPEHNIHALQLEVNRALYLDEVSLVLRPEIPQASLGRHCHRLRLRLYSRPRCFRRDPLRRRAALPSRRGRRRACASGPATSCEIPRDGPGRRRTSIRRSRHCQRWSARYQSPSDHARPYSRAFRRTLV